jgi:uncharacterized protein (DUF1800 family)
MQTRTMLWLVPFFFATASTARPSPAAATALAARAATPANGIVWDARAVEHLYNRAGFGARPAEIEEAVRLGQRAVVERLVRTRVEVEPFFVEPFDLPRPRELRELGAEEQQKLRKEVREKDRRQMIDYASWWFRRMESGEDPLREKMVLFWHGFFTTSVEEVQRSAAVLGQDQLMRENALGSYATLLSGITKDPAMLVYLDNQVNRKGKPNENFARELMELFSLGVGNYSEQDVKEAARTLTGRGVRDGAYFFDQRQHDDGEKTVLGKTGKLDGDDLVAILLEQDACANYVTRRLITWFEGVEPEPRRAKEYASFLREKKYALQPFLERLFEDPEFYRPEARGARVQSPIEFLVGTSRRLGIDAPPLLLASGASLLGQRVFAPPSVKGWDEGLAWITTASLMQRGNLAGLMLGLVKIDDVLSQADLESPADEPAGEPMTGAAMPEGEMRGSQAAAPKSREADPASKGEHAGEAAKPPAKPRPGQGQKGGFAYQALRKVEAFGWAPSVNFCARLEHSGTHGDAEIVDRMLDDLLAIDPPAVTCKRLREFLTRERALLGVRDGHLLEAGAPAERLLRRLAHLILSLPEAQLS